jgi:hypothetical protein
MDKKMNDPEQFLVYVQCVSNPEYNKYFEAQKAMLVEQSSLYHAIQSVLDDVSEILMRAPGRPGHVILEGFVTQDRQVVLKVERTVHFRGRIITTNSPLSPVRIGFYDDEEKEYESGTMIEVAPAESPFCDNVPAVPAKWVNSYWCRLCGAISKDTTRYRLDSKCNPAGIIDHQWQCYAPSMAQYLEDHSSGSPAAATYEAIRGGHLPMDKFSHKLCKSCELYYCRHNPAYHNAITEMTDLAEEWRELHLVGLSGRSPSR